MYHQKVKEVELKLKKMSVQSQSSLSLLKQMEILEPVLGQLEKVVENVDQEVYYNLYKQFKGLFQVFNNSFQDNEDINSIQLSKQNILNASENLALIKSRIFKNTQRRLLWVDFNNSTANQSLLNILEKSYSSYVKVHFYKEANEFKEYENQFKDDAVFIILSGKAAEEGGLIDWLKQKMIKEKSKNLIRGFIVFTSSKGVENLREKYQNDPSNTVNLVTDSAVDMFKSLDNLISPSKYSRTLPLEDVSFFFTNEVKDRLINIHKTGKNHKNLVEFAPGNICLAKILRNAKSFIDQFNINIVLDEIIQKKIVEQLQDIYENQSEILLANGIIHLYTLDKLNFYKLLNTSLCTLNQTLIEIIFPLIEMVSRALFVFDDSTNQLAISKQYGKKVLYRGTSIVSEDFDELFENKMIVLPSFNSFTDDERVAYQFLIQTPSDHKKLMFIFTYNNSSQSYEDRPKCISDSSHYSYEQEFLTQPFLIYKIKRIELIKRDLEEYYEVELLLN